jgi:hypothetical protein
MFLARGVLMLDRDLLLLQKPLEQKNFIVGAGPASSTDEQVPGLLAHRVFITRNSRSFLELAVIHEFSIVDLGPWTMNPQMLANIISKEWLAGSLRNRQPYLAAVDEDGSMTVKEIER